MVERGAAVHILDVYVGAMAKNCLNQLGIQLMQFLAMIRQRTRERQSGHVRISNWIVHREFAAEDVVYTVEVVFLYFGVYCLSGPIAEILVSS